MYWFTLRFESCEKIVCSMLMDNFLFARFTVHTLVHHTTLTTTVLEFYFNLCHEHDVTKPFTKPFAT